MKNIWKNPEKEKPQDGEIILIREYYKSPKVVDIQMNIKL